MLAANVGLASSTPIPRAIKCRPVFQDADFLSDRSPSTIMMAYRTMPPRPSATNISSNTRPVVPHFHRYNLGYIDPDVDRHTLPVTYSRTLPEEMSLEVAKVDDSCAVRDASANMLNQVFDESDPVSEKTLSTSSKSALVQHPACPVLKYHTITPAPTSNLPPTSASLSTVFTGTSILDGQSLRGLCTPTLVLLLVIACLTSTAFLCCSIQSHPDLEDDLAHARTECPSAESVQDLQCAIKRWVETYHGDARDWPNRVLDQHEARRINDLGPPLIRTTWSGAFCSRQNPAHFIRQFLAAIITARTSLDTNSNISFPLLPGNFLNLLDDIMVRAANSDHEARRWRSQTMCMLSPGLTSDQVTKCGRLVEECVQILAPWARPELTAIERVARVQELKALFRDAITLGQGIFTQYPAFMWRWDRPEGHDAETHHVLFPAPVKCLADEVDAAGRAVDDCLQSKEPVVISEPLVEDVNIQIV